MEYPKTENLYARDRETFKAGPEAGFRHPAFDQIKTWVVTEKVDGMNMRVVWEPDENKAPRIAGRTDRANIPGDLLAHMQERFTYERLMGAFSTYTHEGDQVIHSRPARVVLFGEGFGPGIQGGAGAAYGGVKRFILFDVIVDDHWLSWENVKDVARKLVVPYAPELCSACSLEEAKALVAASYLQPEGSAYVEGIVARTEPYLFDGRGKRITFKYKVRDL